MKKGLTVIAVVAALGCVAGLADCLAKSDPKKDIVGEWTLVNSEQSIKFKENGKASMAVNLLGREVSVSGTYSWVAPDQIKVELEGLAALAGSKTYNVAMPNQDELNLTEGKGKTAVYKRAAQAGK